MMEDKVYERITQIQERIASVESKLDIFLSNSSYLRDAINDLAARVAKTEAEAKNAHKRMNAFDETIRWTIGIGVTISGIVCSFLTQIFGK